MVKRESIKPTPVDWSGYSSRWAKGVQANRFQTTGKRILNVWDCKDVCGASQDESARRRLPVDSQFQGCEQGRDPLNLIQHDAAREVRYEPHRVRVGGCANYVVVEADVPVVADIGVCKAGIAR